MNSAHELDDLVALLSPVTSKDVLSRAFKALNGELGVQLADATLFLAACKRDGVKVLGWELWLADHSWDNLENRPRRVPVPGYWCGLIPESASGAAGFYGGEGDADACQSQIGELDFEAGALGAWRENIRINFTLD
jgi:hypothetical protein